MKKISLILTFILMAGVLAMNAETRRVALENNFTSLDTYAGVVVKYNCSNTSSPYMILTGPTEKINNLSIRHKGNTLSLGPKKDRRGSCNGNMIRGVVVTVFARMPRNIDASSGSSVSINNTVTASSADIDVETSSGASVSLRSLTCKSLDLEASSGSSITTLNVKARSMDIDSSSGSSIKTGAVNCHTLSCEATSGSVITVSGQTTNGNFEASSGGAIKGSGLRVKESCYIDKSSGGSVNVSR